MRRIDLNCDMGEGAGHDTELMPLVTSANIACGGHAGDAETMRATVELALRHGVAIGAHPGLEDRRHFGRRELPLAPADVTALMWRQIRLLEQIVRSCGGRIAHVKPHGVLYNMAARDAALARAVVAAVLELDPRLTLIALAGSELTAAARAHGLRVASEAFADRTYQPDGSLTPRSRPNALITDEALAVAQVLSLIREGCVRVADGRRLAIAVRFLRRLRTEFAAADVAIRPFGD